MKTHWFPLIRPAIRALFLIGSMYHGTSQVIALFLNSSFEMIVGFSMVWYIYLQL